jgi:hypothetical protein
MQKEKFEGLDPCFLLQLSSMLYVNRLYNPNQHLRGSVNHFDEKYVIH